MSATNSPPKRSGCVLLGKGIRNTSRQDAKNAKIAKIKIWLSDLCDLCVLAREKVKLFFMEKSYAN